MLQLKGAILIWLERRPIAQLPNQLTLARIYFAPIVCAGMLMFDDSMFRWSVLGVYALIALFDLLDGYLARVWNAESEWGARWDPRADKVLVVGVLGTAVLDLGLEGSMWYAIICAFLLGVTVTRDFLVDRWREKVSIPSSKAAKWKTAVQMIGLGFLVVGPTADWAVYATLEIGMGVLFVATCMAVYTGNQYYWKKQRVPVPADIQ